jgi:hypothetical protein
MGRLYSLRNGAEVLTPFFLSPTKERRKDSGLTIERNQGDQGGK